MLEMYEKTGYEHLIDFNWKDLNTDIYFGHSEILETLDISEDKLNLWSNFFSIEPIIDFDGAKIYPKSWLKPLQILKNTEIEIGGFTEENRYDYDFYLVGWSNDEIVPRIKLIFENFEINFNNLEPLKIWNAYKTFIKEQISDPLVEGALEYIYASENEEYYSWLLIRQTCTYIHHPAAEEYLQHLAYVHFTIELKYELSNELKNLYLSKDFTRIYSEDDWIEFVQTIESDPVFKILIEKKPFECKISMEPQ